VIFTCVSGGQQMDAVRILASNTDTTNTIVLTLEVAGTAASNQMCWSIPPLSTFELPIMRGNSGAVIRAFASIANKINCYRDANRYTL
jgi:hypothetical protein